MLIRLGGIIGLIALAIWLYAVFDSITAPADRVRNLPKAVWVIIILLFVDVGAIAWLLLGRPRPEAGAAAPRAGSPFGWQGHGTPPAVGRGRRATAPDDDADFLRRLEDEMRRDKPDPGDEPRG